MSLLSMRRYYNPNIFLAAAGAALAATIILGLIESLDIGLPMFAALLAILYLTLKTKILAFNPTQKSLLGLYIFAAAFIYYNVAIVTPDFIERGDKILRWGYLDKRAFSFGLVLTYVTICFVKFLDCLQTALPDREAETTPSKDWLFPRSTLARLGAGLIGAYLFFTFGTLVVTPDVLIDFHMEGSIGSMKQLHEGAIPYVDAKTQYGPGMQILFHEMMDVYGHTYEGAWRSQQLLNLISLTGFGFLLFWFAGPWVGTASYVFMITFPSTLLMFQLPGWAIYLRWIGGIVVILFLAEILFSQKIVRSKAKAIPLLISVGTLLGVLCFLSQETVTCGIVGTICLLGLATGNKNFPFNDAVLFGIVFFMSATVAFLAAISIFIGPMYIMEVLSDYLRGPRLVSQGYSNTHMNQANLFYSMFFALGIFAHIIAFILLATLSKSGQLSSHRLKVFTGIIIASAFLNYSTILRVDIYHTNGPAFLIYTLFIVIFVMLCHWRNLHRETLPVIGITLSGFLAVLFIDTGTLPKSQPSLGAIAKALVLQPSFKSAVQTLTPKDPAAPAQGITEFSAVSRILNDPENSSARMRKFYLPVAAHLEYHDIDVDPHDAIILLPQAIKKIVGDRPAVITDRFNVNRYSVNASALYFYADITPATTITEPVISIWLQSEADAWKTEINASEVECIITRHSEDEYVDSWVESLGEAPIIETIISVKNEAVGRAICLNE